MRQGEDIAPYNPLRLREVPSKKHCLGECLAKRQEKHCLYEFSPFSHGFLNAFRNHITR